MTKDMVKSVETDMENPRSRKKWRRNIMKRRSNPIGKRTINDNNKGTPELQTTQPTNSFGK